MHNKQDTAVSVEHVGPGWLMSKEPKTPKALYETQFVDIIDLPDYL